MNFGPAADAKSGDRKIISVADAVKIRFFILLDYGAGLNVFIYFNR